MAITHFLWGANGCFVNEFKGTRKKIYGKWLMAQLTRNTRLMEDDDTHKAVERFEAEERCKELIQNDRHRNKLH
jgi:hypothetical protein